ncbi:hypothetical protein ACFLXB_01270 [Chloroflexota bacterium]
MQEIDRLFAIIQFSWRYAYFSIDFAKKGVNKLGGYGSTRWNYHIKKTTVEDCFKLTIKFLKSYLVPGNSNSIRWLRGEEEIGSISYRVHGNDRPSEISLNYTIGARSGHPEDFEYRVNLTTTPLSWGGERYWFVCPLQGCYQRVGCLYLPPGGKYFGCRHCYQLSYKSRQEGNSSRMFLKEFAMGFQDMYPGITWKDVRALLKNETTKHMEKLEIERYLRDWEEYDPYEGYLTERELCQKSGLSLEQLESLKGVRLLVPDTQDGRYRPKLAGWGKKLAGMLNDGWSVDDIKIWSKERWKKGNPRK